MLFFFFKIAYMYPTKGSFGEGNGNPLQCPCLENPRDRGALWAAIFGVAQRRTRLKWLTSSSSKGSLMETATFRRCATLQCSAHTEQAKWAQTSDLRRLSLLQTPATSSRAPKPPTLLTNRLQRLAALSGSITPWHNSQNLGKHDTRDAWLL